MEIFHIVFFDVINKPNFDSDFGIVQKLAKNYSKDLILQQISISNEINMKKMVSVSTKILSSKTALIILYSG